MITAKEWIVIHQALAFTAQYSEVSGKPKKATDEIKRVKNIVHTIVEGCMYDHAQAQQGAEAARVDAGVGAALGLEAKDTPAPVSKIITGMTRK